MVTGTSREAFITRRTFIRYCGAVIALLNLPIHLLKSLNHNKMMKNTAFDVIVIGGSYSGLAAGMALGRALKKVLIIDSANPCNKQTPYSHNFLTNDGKTPAEIAALAKQQVAKYDTVTFFYGLAAEGRKTGNGFEILTATGETFWAGKLIFATGIRDVLPNIQGFAACWGISVLHCPYCHGYEVKNKKTGILGNGDFGYELSGLISNWANDLTLFTNGASALTPGQAKKLKAHAIPIVEKEIEKLEHSNGHIHTIIFRDGTAAPVEALYAPRPFEQHCSIPQSLGCGMTDEGYIKTDALQETTVHGIFACGDNASRMRTVANAVAAGTTAGIAVSKKMILEGF
jgi:thioredoxin reductase